VQRMLATGGSSDLCRVLRSDSHHGPFRRAADSSTGPIGLTSRPRIRSLACYMQIVVVMLIEKFHDGSRARTKWIEVGASSSSTTSARFAMGSVHCSRELEGYVVDTAQDGLDAMRHPVRGRHPERQRPGHPHADN
jgi:hypothetical protein